MPPPNPLSIATSSLTRLIREEASYHKEQQQQEAAIAKLESQSEDKENEGEEGNREFSLNQQVRQDILDLFTPSVTNLSATPCIPRFAYAYGASANLLCAYGHHVRC